LIAQYRTVLHQQLENHKVFSKLDLLQQAATNNTWTEEHTSDYQALDTVITEAMLHAESNTGRSFTTTYEWSPALKQIVQARRYWSMRLRNLRRSHPATARLLHYKQEGGIVDDPYTTEQQLIDQLKATTIRLRDFPRRHRELRESHLEALAEARVIS